MALASGSAPLVLAQNTLFTLGNVAFTAYEAPEELPIGSSQNLGIKNFSEIEKAAGPGSWVLNSQLILKAKEHSYNIGKNLN